MLAVTTCATSEQPGAVHASRDVDVATERDRIQLRQSPEIVRDGIGKVGIGRERYLGEVGRTDRHHRLRERDAEPARADGRVDARVATGEDADPERHAVPAEDRLGLGQGRNGILRLRRDEREVLSRIGQMGEVHLEPIDPRDLSAEDGEGLRAERRRHRTSQLLEVHDRHPRRSVPCTDARGGIGPGGLRRHGLPARCRRASAEAVRRPLLAMVG
jgi:hypothetical protein